MASGDIVVTVTAVGSDTRGTAVNFAPTAKTFTSIADVYYRPGLITSTTVQTLLTVGGTAGGNNIVTLNCLIIINLDSTETVILGFIDTGVKSAYLQLGPGETFVYMADQLETDDDTGAVFSAFTGIDTITVDAVANTPRISVLAF